MNNDKNKKFSSSGILANNTNIFTANSDSVAINSIINILAIGIIRLELKKTNRPTLIELKKSNRLTINSSDPSVNVEVGFVYSSVDVEIGSDYPRVYNEVDSHLSTQSPEMSLCLSKNSSKSETIQGKFLQHSWNSKDG